MSDDVLALLAVRRAEAPIKAYYSVAAHASALHDLMEGLYKPGAVIEVASREEMERTAAELLYPDVAQYSAQEEWVTKDGRRMKIGDMAPQHLVHALAMIVRLAREGRSWYMDENGKMRHTFFFKGGELR